MDTNQLGYRFFNLSESELNSSWLEFFNHQTLGKSSSNQQDSLHITGDNLPEDAPRDKRLCMELLAWALLTREHCDVILCPLHFSIRPDQPTEIEPAENISVINSIKKGGYLALSADPEKLTKFHETSNVTINVCAVTTALVNAKLLSEKKILRTFNTSSIKRYLKNRLTLEQKIWIKHKWQLLKDLFGLGQKKETIENSLARKKTWNPHFLQPSLSINLPISDTRIPILIATHWLELGGAEKFALDLIKALPKEKYAIYVTTDVSSSNEWSTELEGLVEEIVHLPEFLLTLNFPMFYDYYISSRQIQLMHIHHAPQAYRSLIHIRRFHPKIKILDSLHILELPPNSGGYPEFSAREHEAFIDHHHVISRQINDFLIQRWRIPEDKITLAYLNVDCDYFNPDNVETRQIRSKLNLPDSACLVGFIGRFADQKRPLTFIKAAQQLTKQWHEGKQVKSLHFIMAGSGLLETEVKKAIKLTQLENIHLIGEIADTRPVYQDCDVLMMPSVNEGLALITYEAMAMRTPIFFTDVGAQSELLKAEFIVTSDYATADHLAKAVWPYLLDPMKRKETGEQLRAYILQYHQHTKTFQQILGLYQQLLT